MAYEEINAAFLTFQEDADQIYLGTTVLDESWGRERDILLDVFAEVVAEIAMTHDDAQVAPEHRPLPCLARASDSPRFAGTPGLAASGRYGVKMGEEIGARTTDLVWVQMHPTGLPGVPTAQDLCKTPSGAAPQAFCWGWPPTCKDRGRSLFLSGGGIELARKHEEIQGAFLTFQKEVDQIYPGRKEKLNCTDAFPVQAASSDRAKQTSAAAFVGADVVPAMKEGSVASQALSQPSCYADPSLDEATLIGIGKYVLVARMVDVCGMMCSFPTIAVGSKQGMGDVEYGRNPDFYMPPAEVTPEVMRGMHAATKVQEHGDKKLLSTNITADDSYALFDRGRAGDLGEKISELADAGVPVPGGLRTTSHAYKGFPGKGGINDFITDQSADESIYEDVEKLLNVGREFRDKSTDTPFQGTSEDGLKAAWDRAKGGDEKFTFTVCSHATADDLPDASFAGQQGTYLNVMGYADMQQKVHLVFASLFTDRVIPYRHVRGFEHEKVQLCDTCLKRVRSETGSAGVMLSLDTASGLENVDSVISAYGLGATVADGTVTPAEWSVFMPTIVQARPETVDTRKKADVIEEYKMLEKGGETTPGGSAVSRRIGSGKVHVLTNIERMNEFQKGKVLVADMTDPDWEPIMKAGTNRNGCTCHAAIPARELDIPAVVSDDSTDKVKMGDAVKVSCAEGDTGFTYKGEPKLEGNAQDLGGLPKVGLKIVMHFDNPEIAFSLGQLPNEGTGSARLEFVINYGIGVYPKTLPKCDTLDADTKASVDVRMRGYPSPKELYIDKIAEGVTTLAASVYPKRIIVRLSDFKSNEHQTIMGGEQCALHEEYPSIGFGGCEHYKDPFFEECFAMELEAMKTARDDMGPKNVEIMIPFVCALDMAKDVNELMGKHNLKRGEDGPQVNMTAGMPNVYVCTTDDITESVGALVCYIDPGEEEMTLAYTNLLLYRNTIDGCGLMCSFLTLAVGNNQGMRDVEYDTIYDFYMPSAFLSVLSLALSGLMSLTFMTIRLLQLRFGDTDQFGPYCIKLTPYIIHFWGILSLNLFWSNEDGTQPVRVRDVYAPEFQIFMNPLWSFSGIPSVSVFMHHPENIQPDCHAPGSQLSAAIFVTDVGYLPDGTRLNGDKLTNVGKEIRDDIMATHFPEIAEDKYVDFTLRDAEVNGPSYRQEWEGMKLSTPIISDGMNAMYLLAFLANLGHRGRRLSGAMS